VVVSVMIDEDDAFAGDAYAEVKGLSETGRKGASLAEEVEDAVNDALERAGHKVIADDDQIETLVRRTARQVALDEIGKKPEVIVMVSRLMAA
jgi:ribonuclease J